LLISFCNNVSKASSSIFSKVSSFNVSLARSANCVAGAFTDDQMYAITQKIAMNTTKGIHIATRAFPLGL
jgi:hypothetical protein